MLETIPSPGLACSPLGKWEFQQTDGPGEQTKQRAQYYYDSHPLNGNYSQNAWGRLAAVEFADEDTGAPFAYSYSYLEKQYLERNLCLSLFYMR
jgi:hypothetical protein